MDNKKLYQNWFSLVAIAILLIGIIMAFIVEPASLPVEEKIISKWILGLLGATLMGWGATVFLIARYAFSHNVPVLLNAILLGLVVWFVPDTLISAYFGAYFNVVINIIILTAALIPLIAGKKTLQNPK